MASFGFGSVGALRSGNVSLAIMALAGTMGVMAGVATRWAALPRPAIATMVLSIVPPTLELASRGGADLFAAAALSLAAISIITFTTRNREALLASVIATEQLLRQAQTDHLTGLPNRSDLLQRMEEACTRLPAGRGFAVRYIDLDGFKAVNDTHGHAAGDEVLRDVAGRLRAALGPDQMVARIGGDEFVALVMDADPLTASGVADAVIAAVSHERNAGNGNVIRIGCSIGVSVAPAHGRTPETLLRHADTALYSAKSQGKGQTDMFRALEI
jgi:diguanylate cyclase (GGDEF)-like protein